MVDVLVWIVGLGGSGVTMVQHLPQVYVSAQALTSNTATSGTVVTEPSSSVANYQTEHCIPIVAAQLPSGMNPINNAAYTYDLIIVGEYGTNSVGLDLLSVVVDYTMVKPALLG